MHKQKKSRFAKALAFLAVTAIVCLGAQNAVAASRLSSSQEIKSFMDSFRDRIKNKKTAEPKTNTAPEPVPAPTSGKQWGAYAGETYSSFDSFQQKVGKKADIQAVFMGWGDGFPTDIGSSLKANGQTMLIFWEPYGTSLDQIINGNSDSYIREFASQAKSYGGQVILAPFHEMNGDWDPWGGTVGSNTPEKVVQAWKHVHDLFSGVANVKWGWAVNNVSVPDTAENNIANYYPGASYVDYVGVDGFNFGNPWQTYSQVFSSSLSQLKTYNKPIFIFSMASAAGSQKAQWITDALSKINSDPSIKGWIWFNENKEQNWLVWSDQESLKAFQQGCN